MWRRRKTLWRGTQIRPGLIGTACSNKKGALSARLGCLSDNRPISES
jgi:hypothetical protein